MSKSIKLEEDVYLDSSNIVYNGKTLDSILKELIPVTLFSNGSGVSETGTYDLNDSVYNYTYLEVYVGRGFDYGGQSVKFLRMLNGVTILLPYASSNATYIKELHLTFSGKTFTLDKIISVNISNGETPSVYSTSENYNKIYRIVGYK